MSVTIPAVELAPSSLYNTTCSDVTPTWWEFVRFGILVVRPDTTIWSLSAKVCDVDINALTWVALSRTYTTLS